MGTNDWLLQGHPSTGFKHLLNTEWVYCVRQRVACWWHKDEQDTKWPAQGRCWMCKPLQQNSSAAAAMGTKCYKSTQRRQWLILSEDSSGWVGWWRVTGDKTERTRWRSPSPLLISHTFLGQLHSFPRLQQLPQVNIFHLWNLSSHLSLDFKHIF